MENENPEAKKIIDDIEAGLIDDPLEDYNYLKQESAKYKEHPLADEILSGLAPLLFVKIPGELNAGIMKESAKEEDFNAFNFMIEEVEKYLLAGNLAIGGLIAEKLIGAGVDVPDDSETEYRSFETPMQYALYEKFFKSEKKIIGLPFRLSTLYGYYGSVLYEYQKIDEARNALEIALKSNPLDFRVFFEYAETFKVKKELDVFEKLNREYLGYAYTRAAIAHLYRNLGYVYIEKKKLFIAIALFNISLVFDPDNKIAMQELEYIHNIAEHEIRVPSQEEAVQALEQENIPVGPSKDVLQAIYNNAYISSRLNHDVEKTEYLCKIWYDLTGDEDTVKEYMEIARDSSSVMFPQAADPEEDPYESPFDYYKKQTLSKLFPEFPEVKECRMRIHFNINSTKYGPTIHQIVSYIDDISKVVEEDEVTLFFADLMSVAKHMDFINDIYDIANGWKSFEISINDISIDKDDFRYFNDYLSSDLEIDVTRIGLPEEIRKKYKRAAAPKHVTKAKPEDGISINIEGCTPQEIIQGIAMTYAKIYLSGYDARSRQISQDEYVVWANDFVVDFRVSPYGYAETFHGEPARSKPYEFCTYIIQELTYNNLFTFNLAGFKRCFEGAYLSLECMRFDGICAPGTIWNRFYVINEKMPELKLQDIIDAWEGIKYQVVLFEMDNADGTIGTGIGYTTRDAKTLAKKVIKELERPARSLSANGVSCLDSGLSKSFVNAFLSWKGKPIVKRLEEHFRYYSIEEIVKESGGQHELCRTYTRKAEAGEFSGVERKTYADIERKKKK